MPKRSAVVMARRLRREMSPPEVKLWQYLRTRPGGLKFRHQHPVGDYALDFYCAAAKLAIEVDGFAHDVGDRPQRDDLRDAWLREQGFRVLRLPAKDVMRNFEGAVAAILTACGLPLHQPTAGPPPHAGHGEEK